MKLSDHGVELIASFEGYRAAPYRDAVGVWTIGFGSTKGVGPGTKPLTRAQALARLKAEVNASYGPAVDGVGVPLTQNQFDALVSFVYNVGPGGVAASTGVGRALRARDYKGAANHLLDWDKAGGHALAGLTRRRQAERVLFLTPGVPSKLDKWRHELAERRLQLEDEKAPGTRKFLIRRIGELKRAIKREEEKS